MIKRIICLFRGHDINPDDSIIKDVIKDKRNWLCKCRRCGWYEMRDGAISGNKIMISEREALCVKWDLMAEHERLRSLMWSEDDV